MGRGALLKDGEREGGPPETVGLGGGPPEIAGRDALHGVTKKRPMVSAMRFRINCL